VTLVAVNRRKCFSGQNLINSGASHSITPSNDMLWPFHPSIDLSILGPQQGYPESHKSCHKSTSPHNVSGQDPIHVTCSCRVFETLDVSVVHACFKPILFTSSAMQFYHHHHHRGCLFPRNAAYQRADLLVFQLHFVKCRLYHVNSDHSLQPSWCEQTAL